MTAAQHQHTSPRVPAQTQRNTIASFLRLIRFSHTIFALPFALASLIVAANGYPSPRILLLVVACMISARTAAMLFNRLVDWTIDQRNPRTASRHLLASRTTIAIALVASSVAFVGFASLINKLTFVLSPAALGIIFFYSVTKRFTKATHFFLGFALGIAPIAAWIAQTGRVDLPPMVLALGIVCWVAGFDLIYATQDYEFDRREGLHSLVVRLGVTGSLRMAQFLHLAMLVALIAFGVVTKSGAIYFCALILVGVALFYEHNSARRLDIAGINQAFFQSNAFVSAVFLAAVWLDRVL
ncbi:MAG: 4-hydroxybenzoate polyprenyltransferase [Verrucomicrobiota bacterium]|jgi:4-hydroxybenzoate polyprenyltransferase